MTKFANDVKQLTQCYLYRVLEVDDELDPLDHGALRATDPDDAFVMITEHLIELGFSGDLEVRLYPMVEVTYGLFPSEEHFIDRVLALPEDTDDDQEAEQ